MCEPILKLLRKNNSIQWDEKCQQEQIKECLMNPLVPPRPGKFLLLYLSVIEAAMGCMLAQMDNEGIERVVYYLSLSKRMLAYEENFYAIEKTCLALVWATKKLRHYMLAYQVIIISKMDPLKYLFEKPALTGRMAFLGKKRLIVLSFKTLLENQSRCVQAVVDWETPRKVQELRFFVRLVILQKISLYILI